MEFRLLGPVEVVAEGRAVALGGSRPTAVLVAMLLRLNQPVTTDYLVEAAWTTPPPSVAANLRNVVSRLRRRLERPGGPQLVSRPGGYQLTADPDSLDVLRFEAGLASGQAAIMRGDLVGGAQHLRAALALWRGAPLHALPATPALAMEVGRLEEFRLTAIEAYAGARLALGDHEGVAGELPALVAQHPFRERLWAHLMVALYRCGRQVDALAAYADVRQHLASELGMEPGPELHRLQEQILRADPALDIPADSAPSGQVEPAPQGSGEVAPAVVDASPAQLPPAIADFTARNQEVTLLCDGLTRDMPPEDGLTEDGLGWDGLSRDDHDGLVPRGDGVPFPAPAVWAINGAAGVGKTSLAIHVAHMVRGAYPDGQLYLNLRGVQPRPVAPAVALDRLLRALGVPGSAIPAALDDRIALYRARLADRRVLVVLDNAADESQVRPLLPGTPASAVLVTSRPVLAGLEGAHVVPLDVLPPADALLMLRRAVGAARVAAEPAAAEAIVDRCGRLPLAVRVAAARLVARPHWRLAQLAARLFDARKRLDELSVGDLDVRASFALSYQALDSQHRRAFCLLAMLDMTDFPAWVVGPLLDLAPEQAEDVVEALVDARLVDVAGRDATNQTRFRLHDLLRSYGRDRAARELGDPRENVALQRLLDAWLAIAERADRALPRQSRMLDRGPGLISDRNGALAHALLADPLAWFDIEWGNLRSIVEQAATLGFNRQVWGLAAALAGACDQRARFADWDHLHGVALDCLSDVDGRPETGEPAAGWDVRRAEAILRQQLGLLRCRQNRLAEAMSEYFQSKDLFEALGDTVGASYGWEGMAWMFAWRGHPAEARECLEQAMAGFAATGCESGLIDVLCSLGGLDRRAGDFDSAQRHLSRAWELTKARSDDSSEMMVALELGRLRHAQGDTRSALTFLELSLARAVKSGDPDLASNVRLFLAEAHLRAGSGRSARYEIQQALPFFQRQLDRAGLGWAWRLLSQVSLVDGDFGAAVDYAQRAIATVTEQDLPPEHARALRELGRACRAAGRHEEAERHWRTAITWFDGAGFTVEADELRREIVGDCPPRPVESADRTLLGSLGG